MRTKNFLKPKSSQWLKRVQNFPYLNVVIILIPLSLLVFAILTVQKTLDFRTKALTSDVLLTLLPSSNTIQAGDTLPMTITMNTQDQTVSAAEIHLTFDPAIIQAESIQIASFLPVVLQQATINNGTASFTLGSQPTSPQKGADILATITFKAIKNGTANISFASTTQVAAIGRNDNALGTSTGATIIVANPTVTEVPTLQPTNTQVQPTNTQTQPTHTPIPTAQPTSTGTPYPTNTATPRPTATNAPIPSPTNTIASFPTSTTRPTPTNTRIPTRIPTATPTKKPTPTPRGRFATPTNTPRPSATPWPTIAQNIPQTDNETPPGWGRFLPRILRDVLNDFSFFANYYKKPENFQKLWKDILIKPSPTPVPSLPNY